MILLTLTFHNSIKQQYLLLLYFFISIIILNELFILFLLKLKLIIDQFKIK